MGQSSLEIAFTRYIQLLGRDLPRYQTEYRFHPTRKWRLDIAWPEHRVGVELEGGLFIHGRHSRGKGYEADMEKYNQLALHGWTMLRFSIDMLTNDPPGCVDQVRELLSKAKAPAA